MEQRLEELIDRWQVGVGREGDFTTLSKLMNEIIRKMDRVEMGREKLKAIALYYRGRAVERAARCDEALAVVKRQLDMERRRAELQAQLDRVDRALADHAAYYELESDGE